MERRNSYESGVLFSYLRLSPIFSTCTDEQLARVEAQGRFEHRGAGDVIVRQGEPGEELHVITSGTARVERDGEEVTTLRTGDLFGELALFDPAPRNASVVAGGDVAMVVLHRDAFRELLGTTPGILDEVLRGMAHRLHELDGRV